MTVLIKTNHGVYVNLDNVFAIDYSTDEGKNINGDDIGQVFAYSALMTKDGAYEMELFKGTEEQTRKWMELFSEEILCCTGVGVTVIDLTNEAKAD